MTNPSDHTSQESSPGWFPDPSGGAGARWWDGQTWTQHVSDSVPQVAAASIEPRRVSPGTPRYTPHIWIIVAIPVVWILLVLFLNTNGYRIYSALAPSVGPLADYTGPGILLLQQLSIWLVYGLSVMFAFFDRRVLLRRGFDRPFHWAWSFLGSYVYVIGRSIIVRRRSDGGLVPMWLALGILVVLAAGAIMLIVAVVLGVQRTFY